MRTLEIFTWSSSSLHGSYLVIIITDNYMVIIVTDSYLVIIIPDNYLVIIVFDSYLVIIIPDSYPVIIVTDRYLVKTVTWSSSSSILHVPRISISRGGKKYMVHTGRKRFR